MRSLIFFTLVGLISVGCCYMPRMPLDRPEEGANVQMSVDKIESSFSSFNIQVQFYEWEDDWDFLVQEVFLPGGTTLVEVFRMENGQFLSCRYDHHHVKYDVDFFGVYHRRMFVYPAEVEGVDWDKDFAHLPENRDGTVKTTVGSNFNEKYQKNHVTKGRVIADRRDQGFWWSIEWKNGEVVVQVPEEHRYTAKED